MARDKKPVIALLVICLFTLTCCGTSGEEFYMERAEDLIGLDLGGASMAYFTDGRDGIMAEGSLVMKLTFDEKRFEEIAGTISQNECWEPLPMDEKLAEWAVYLSEASSSGRLPVEGCYLFYDRSSESKDPYDRTETWNRSSLNFSIYILDKEEQTITYMEYDS